MVKYLIQVVQNGLAGSLLAALLCALLLKDTGAGENSLLRPKLLRRLLRFTLGGAGGALIVAVLRRTTRLINREYINTAVLSLAIPLGTLFLLLFWGLFRKKRPVLHEKLFGLAGPALAGLLLFYTLPVIFLYPAEFVLPGESYVSTAFLFNLIGFLAGLGLVFLSALGLYKTTLRLSRTLGGAIFTAALAVNMINQLSAIVQFLLARRLVSVPRWVFRLMVRVINYNSVFLYVIMALGFLLPVILFALSLRPVESLGLSPRNPAEIRKIRAGKRGDRRWAALVVSGFLVSVLVLTVLMSYHRRGVVLTPAEPMTISGGEIHIPVEKVNDGHLHRFNYTAQNNSESIEMRFIVIKKNESSYGVGLDACDICGPTGYYERKNQVICKLCDVVMNISTIGFKGGCNPVPLAYTLRGGIMVISREDLENESSRFK